MNVNAERIKEAVDMPGVCEKYGIEVNRTGFAHCPFHGERTASLKVYPEGRGWYCYGCGAGGDVISFVSRLFGLSFSETLSKMNTDFNLDLPLDASRSNIMDELAAIRRHLDRMAEKTESKQAQVNQHDFMSYYRECISNLEEYSRVRGYYVRRGLSTTLAKKFWFGFDPTINSLVIPVSRSFFVARNIDPDSKRRYHNPANCNIDLFNKKALFDTEPCFITEGAFDALSFLEIGCKAVALNSTSNVRKLLDEIKAQTTCAPLILCLDNDKAGETATDELMRGLRSLGVPFVVGDVCGEYKDPNAALVADRDAFTERARLEKIRVLS